MPKGIQNKIRQRPKSRSGIVIALLFSMALQGCASSAINHRLDQKLASEPPIKHRHELQAEIDHNIDVAPGLSSAQREELKGIGDWVREKAARLDQRSLALRGVLISDVISKRDESREITLIRARLRKIERQRVNLMLEATREVEKMMGHLWPRHRRAREMSVDPALMVFPW